MAGLIPQNFIDDLIARTDIVEVINARVPLKRKGKEYTACCPFHNEKTPSFTVSEAKQFYYCFGCHAKGNAIGFLMDYEHMSYIDAIESLAADAHLDVPREGGIENRQPKNKQPLYGVLDQASKLFQQSLKKSERAIAYLKQRGLSGEIAKRFRIGYAPDAWNFLDEKLGVSDIDKTNLKTTGLVINKDDGKRYDRFRDRIMFPITDQRGRIIGFGGRILDKGEPKYLNSPENSVFHKGYELYGLYETKKALRKIDRILVAEGYMDVVALAQHGIDYAVASLGTATTSEQIQKIFRITHEIIFCYDGDNAGKQAAWRALENTLPLIRDGKIAKFLFLPEKEDPDTMVRKEGKVAFEQRITNATPLSEFLFNSLKTQCDMSTREGKAQFASKANTLIQRLHNSLFKDMLIEELSSLVGLSQQLLEEKINDVDKHQKHRSVTTTRPVDKQQTHGQQNRGQQVQNNKTRIAIALLLQNPTLATQCRVPDRFSNAFTKGLPLLHELQMIIDTNNEITPAALLERFRDNEQENALHKLSILRTPETENSDNIIEVYSNLIDRLDYEDRDEYFKYKFANDQPLSAEEQEEYLNLCTRKQ